jgi:hypothetical protein
MKLRTLLWLVVLLLPGRFWGQVVTGQIEDKGGAVYNVLAYGLACDGTTDDYAAMVNLFAVLTAIGKHGGIIQFSPTGHYCKIGGSNPLVVPANVHFRGCGSSGINNGPLPLPACGLDLQNSGDAKMIFDTIGSGSIIDMAIVDTASDCGIPLVVVGATTMLFERSLFQGTHPEQSACNDAIVMGTTSHPYSGYKAHILNNVFDKIQRAVVEGSNANGVEVSGNRIQFTCGNLSGGAFEVYGNSAEDTYGGTFSNNDIEMGNPYAGGGAMENYQWGIYLGPYTSGFSLYGNTCSDPVSGTNLACYAYDPGSHNNFGFLAGYNWFKMLGAVDTSTGSLSASNPTIDPYDKHTGSYPHVIYNTCWGDTYRNGVSNFCENNPTHATIGPITMTTNPYWDTRYRFSFTASQSDVGAGCTSASSLKVTLSYTDSDSVQAMASPVVGFAGNSFTGVVDTWMIPYGSKGNTSAFRSFTFEFSARRNTNVQFTAAFTPGSGCSTAPSYAFYPHLEQLP